MDLAWVAVLALAVGVPAAMWLRAQTMKPPREPYDSPIPRLNRADRWLYQHYRLGMTDRSRVSQAVTEGRELAEPRLRAAAAGLADARPRRPSQCLPCHQRAEADDSALRAWPR